jgi:CubicO group peptidase (beta-lactamase class C family)
MTAPRRLDPAALDTAFARAAEQVADGSVPFVVLAMADAAGLVRAEAFAGPAAGGVDVDAVCPIASITKPIVATAVMQLVAEGKVALTDGIDRYVPEASPGKPTVTIWHLLSHTSGVQDFDLRALLTGEVRRDDLVRRAATAPLGFEPGSQFEYVSSTFDLLGAMIERVTGDVPAARIRRTILDPLGMEDTGFDPWDRLRARIAPLAAATVPGGEGPWEPMAVTEQDQRAFSDLALAGAGLYSTAADLVRFGRAMLRGGELDGVRILPLRFVELMTREQTIDGLGSMPDPLLAAHYALGCGKPDPRTSPASPEAFGHGGITLTRLWIDPACDLVFVYLSGIWDHAPRPIDVVLQAAYAGVR